MIELRDTAREDDRTMRREYHRQLIDALYVEGPKLRAEAARLLGENCKLKHELNVANKELARLRELLTGLT